MKKGNYWDETNPVTDTSEIIFFVEGKDDAIFFDEILTEENADLAAIRVIVVDGKENFRKSFELLKKSSPYTKRIIKKIVAIRDADSSIETAISEINAAFQTAFSISIEQNRIITRDDISYGCFILPDNENIGDLEVLCLNSVSNSQIYQAAQRFIGEAKNIHGGLEWEFKKLAQVYLAGQQRTIVRGVGMGYRIGYFNRTHQSIEKIKIFIREIIPA
ncbi:DUF3226 domain-containing protein [Chromobacterium subtsugae]|uniref:DUF3226 domain-containing protein n=1 Tax=Chromobacterium subtsugae TaxID=251747 RepID=UPI000AFD24A2|nr:DUF3226 domain-containing protein [Chromobacterium subtsugae]